MQLNNFELEILKHLTQNNLIDLENSTQLKIDQQKLQLTLQKLTQIGLVKQNEKNNKLYTLTEKGKKYVIDLDISTNEHLQKARYGKRSVVLRAIRKHNGEYQWLFFKRLKHPFFGYVGFPTGKINEGDSPVETAIREFNEETGLKMIDWELAGIEHIRAYKKERFQFDVYYYLFNIYHFSGNLHKKSEEGEYFWATLEEFLQMDYYPDMLLRSDAFSYWQKIPDAYNKYLLRKQDNTWQNVPNLDDKIQSAPIEYLDFIVNIDNF